MDSGAPFLWGVHQSPCHTPWASPSGSAHRAAGFFSARRSSLRKGLMAQCHQVTGPSTLAPPCCFEKAGVLHGQGQGTTQAREFQEVESRRPPSAAPTVCPLPCSVVTPFSFMLWVLCILTCLRAPVLSQQSLELIRAYSLPPSEPGT